MTRQTATRRLVAGVDSSTQSCKVVVRDADTGELVRSGAHPHPDGSEVDPAAWWSALGKAIEAAGGLEDVAAISVAAQQHGMVCLDADGRVVRPALLWNDTRSAGAATDLVAELGAEAWAQGIGSVPVAAFTVSKLRWLAEHEPRAAERTAAMCLPHDWLTWRLTGAASGERLGALTTDRGDASGTGYWSPTAGSYRPDLLERALGKVPELPRVLGPAEPAGLMDEEAIRELLGGDGGITRGRGIVVGPGTGDNAAAALGLCLRSGDVVVSIGTSGTVFAVARKPVADPTGTVAGFADATGHHLPLVCTLNAARVLESAAHMLDVTIDELSALALGAPPGADGLTVIPYLDGERTPNRPTAAASVHGWRRANSSPAYFARAAIEGMLCGLADGLDALAEHVEVHRVLLIGGGARSDAVRRIAPSVFGVPVLVPPPGEYVADGAARQAAWALTGAAEPPQWGMVGTEHFEAPALASLRERYREYSDPFRCRVAGDPIVGVPFPS